MFLRITFKIAAVVILAVLFSVLEPIIVSSVWPLWVIAGVFWAAWVGIVYMNNKSSNTPSRF